MAERLTWNQIAEKYPTQWVGLIDVEWEPDNDATIKTAIVKYTGKTKGELTRMQIETKGELIARYTSPNIAFYIDGEAYTVICVGASEDEAADTDLAQLDGIAAFSILWGTDTSFNPR